MSLRDAATREAALKTLLDVIDAEYKTVRREVQQLLDEAAAETGTTQIKALLPDGTPVATVSITSGSAEARVADAEAYTAWVREHYATEVERKFTTSVREAFTKRVLAAMTAAGRTEWADPETGVIHDVPGVVIAPARARGHGVRFTKTGRESVIAAWRAGALADVALPQLAAAETETPAQCPTCPNLHGPWAPDGRCEDCTTPPAQ